MRAENRRLRCCFFIMVSIQTTRGLSHALPPAVRASVDLAQQRLFEGAPASSVLEPLGSVLEGVEEEAVLRIYRKMLGLAPRVASSELAPKLLAHLSERVKPDASIAHLAIKDQVQRGCHAEALACLQSFRKDGTPVNAGSFDLLIHAAAQHRRRQLAYAAYRSMRRCGVSPTTYTLNALMRAELRSRRPQEALRLLQRAESGAPRWPGSAPDACTYSTAMSAAKQLRQYARIGHLFKQLQRSDCLQTSSDACTVPACNLAIEARLRLRDREGAMRVYSAMVSRQGGFPAPRSDTYNTMLSVLGNAGESYAWVLKGMNEQGVEPDEYTMCTLIRLQPTLRLARKVWRWGCAARALPVVSRLRWPRATAQRSGACRPVPATMGKQCRLCAERAACCPFACRRRHL